MIAPDNLADILKSLAWPVVVLVFLVLCKDEIRELLKRLQKAKLPGGTEASFEPNLIGPLLSDLKSTTMEDPEIQPTLPTPDHITPAAVEGLQPSVCRYLLKVANKELEFDEHTEIFANEIDPDHVVEHRSVFGAGFLMGILSFRGVLFKAHGDEDEGEFRIKLKISPTVIDLIRQRLQI